MSLTNNIAASGSCHADAVSLTKSYNVVTSVKPGAGVILPPANEFTGAIFVFNKSPATLQIYATGTDRIDDALAGDGVSLAPKSVGMYVLGGDRQYIEFPIGKGLQGERGERGLPGPRGEAVRPAVKKIPLSVTS